MRAKIFTLEEANNTIPELSKVFDKISYVRTKIQLIKEALDFAGQTKEYHENPDKMIERMGTFTEELKNLVAEVHSYGCLVKDLDKFLVDFYSVKENKLIFLCWKYGEKEIKFWHETQTGFKGRLPLLVKEEVQKN